MRENSMQDFALGVSKLENNKAQIFLSPHFLVCNSVSTYAESRAKLLNIQTH